MVDLDPHRIIDLFPSRETQAAQKYIIREFPSRVEIPAGKEISEEMRALYDTSNRVQRIRFAHQKRGRLYNKRDIPSTAFFTDYYHEISKDTAR